MLCGGRVKPSGIRLFGGGEGPRLGPRYWTKGHLGDRINRAEKRGKR